MKMNKLAGESRVKTVNTPSMGVEETKEADLRRLGLIW
jgi:hypothetical protein